MSTSIVLAILITSLATFSSRFLGAVSSEGIKETIKEKSRTFKFVYLVREITKNKKNIKKSY